MQADSGHAARSRHTAAAATTTTAAATTTTTGREIRLGILRQPVASSVPEATCCCCCCSRPAATTAAGTAAAAAATAKSTAGNPAAAAAEGRRRQKSKRRPGAAVSLLHQPRANEHPCCQQQQQQQQQQQHSIVRGRSVATKQRDRGLFVALGLLSRLMGGPREGLEGCPSEQGLRAFVKTKGCSPFEVFPSVSGCRGSLAAVPFDADAVPAGAAVCCYRCYSHRWILRQLLLPPSPSLFLSLTLLLRSSYWRAGSS